MLNKIYVDVNADYCKDGKVRPRNISFTGGENYSIDKILGARYAHSEKADGSEGMRYTVYISGILMYLFEEAPGRWFIEGE